MHGRLTLWLASAGVICAMLSPPVIHAQLPPRLEKCLPYPTFAEEIRAMQKGGEEKTPLPKIRVDDAIFKGATPLPESIRKQITARLGQTHFGTDSAWIDASRQMVVGALQQHGYFYAQVSAQSRVLSRDPAEEHVSLAFHIAAGPQYRLAEIRFAQAHVFPAGELRKQFPLQDGDIFNLERIRAGIEALTALYGSHGYINFTAAPDLQADNVHQRISVRLELGEGRQFRVGSAEVLGADRAIAEHSLKMPLKPGDVFNSRLIGEFYKENKSALPADVSPLEDTRITQNPRNGTVAIVFDVRTCPSW